MRAFLAFLILSTIGAAPAIAGQRAVYAGADGKRIVVDVADNGDARIAEAGATDYGLLSGGRFYIVGDAGGTRRVVAITDIMAAIDGVVAPIFGDVLTRPLDAPQPLTAFRIVPGQTKRTVAGREGDVIQVYGDDPQHPDQPGDWVIAADPALAPIGQALQGYLIGALLPDAVFRGPAAGERVAEIRKLFAGGTPIQAGRRLTLQSIETAPVTPEQVALPALPLDRAQLLKAMRGGR